MVSYWLLTYCRMVLGTKLDFSHIYQNSIGFMYLHIECQIAPGNFVTVKTHFMVQSFGIIRYQIIIAIEFLTVRKGPELHSLQFQSD